MRITLCFLVLSFSVFCQKETVVSSSIRKVTVFFQGAQIEHSKSIELKPGKQELVFEKLTDFLDPNSVQVKAKGDLTILSVRTRKNFEDPKITHTEISDLNTKKEKLELQDQALRDEYDLLSLDKNLLLKNRDLKGNEQGLKVAELKEAFTFMHQKLNEINIRQSAIYNELETINKEINRIVQEITSQRSKPVINYTEIIVEIDVTKQTTGEFSVTYISPNASWKPYYDMRSEGIGEAVRLEAKALVNQTTGIVWNNVDVVLSTNDPYENTKESILNPWYLNYYNYPQQKSIYARQLPVVDYSGEKLRGEVIDASTGEPLPFAKISFPTNPNISAVTDFEGKFEVVVPKGEQNVLANYVGFNDVQLSITAPYLKFFMQPQALQLEEVVVSANDDVGAEYNGFAGSSSYTLTLETSADSIVNKDRKLFGRRKKTQFAQPIAGNNGTYAWSQNVGATAIQKDLRVEYAIQSKFTIPSDGIDYRVHIVNYELPATYEYHTAPKIDPAIYLTAQISGWEKLNLLSGESNLYFDGTYIGKTVIDANSTNDTLSFSLGKDTKLQIERTRIQDKSSNRINGSRVKSDFTWELKIKNNGGAAIPVIIKDQFPLSANSDIKIKQGEHEGAMLDEKTGILTWKFLLNQAQSKTLTFDYSVDFLNGQVLYIE